ncbi:MAG: hypothetical protein Kow0077_26910 [Anaerolineae bacterium]
MDPNNKNTKKLEWLDEFEELANLQLTEGTACTQVHPIVERWLESLLAGDPPESRDSVWQAMSCLTTEVLYKLTPETILDALENQVDEEEVAMWLESVLLVGRAFQMALDRGDLDDL